MELTSCEVPRVLSSGVLTTALYAGQMREASGLARRWCPGLVRGTPERVSFPRRAS